MALLGAFVVPHPPLIIPEIGRGEEKEINCTIKNYHKVAKRIAELNPDTIIIASPHSIMYSDYIHISPGEVAKGNFSGYGANEVSFKVNYDQELVKALEDLASMQGLSAGTQGEKEPSLDHGTMIPLYFIQQYIKEFKLVRMGLSALSVMDHYHMGKLITMVAEELDRRIVFIASGDLSHKLKEDGPYGFAKEGVQFDREIVEGLKKADFIHLMELPTEICEKAAECGYRSFITMAGVLDGKEVETDFMSYEGPFGVGYAVSAYEPIGIDSKRKFNQIFKRRQQEAASRRKKNEDAYVQLARHSIESYIKTGKAMSLPDKLPEEMLNKKAGVFVSLKKHGNLRGCIGTISPVTESIAHEIVRNSIEAAMMDPRFPPVKAEELDQLVYSVDVLGEPEKIESFDELDVKRYGVIVSSGFKRGLLLPNLEGVNEVEQQIAIAKSKAGVTKGEKVVIERFEVVRHQ